VTRFLLISSSEDAAYAWMARHPDRHPSAAVWSGRFHLLSLAAPFSRLAVSADAFHMTTHIAACLTRVKGPDGLTPGQRLNADDAGQRMREMNASMARHPAGRDLNNGC
jgi:hypothetical protein